MTRANAPTVTAQPTANGRQLVIICPGCGSKHYHGRHNGTCGQLDMFGEDPCTCPLGAGDGHRAAHCDRMPGGYVLHEAAS